MIRIIGKGATSVEVFDVVGRKVETLFSGEADGELKFRWDRSKRAPGIYFLKVKAGDHSISKKLILL